MKTKNRPRRQAKKRKNEYKKVERGRKFNPWMYKYFDVKADIIFAECSLIMHRVRNAQTLTHGGIYAVNAELVAESLMIREC